jgi:hypothetical protein
MTERRVLDMSSRLAEKRINYGAEGLIYKAREHVTDMGWSAELRIILYLTWYLALCATVRRMVTATCCDKG